MRVLQVHTRYREAGGEDNVVAAEYEALHAAGHDVEQFISTNPTNSRQAALTLAASTWNPAAAHRVGIAADRWRPDVAHVHNTWFATSPSVLLALRRRRVPVVMTVHNYRLACANGLFLRDGSPCERCLSHGPLEAVRHRCYRGSRAASAVAATSVGVHQRLSTWSRLVTRFVVLSDFARTRMLLAGLPAEKLVLGGNFVPDPGPRPLPPSASSEVLFVGRLSPEKGVHVLVEAWRRLSPQGLTLRVVGDGTERARLAAASTPGVDMVGRLTPDEVRARLQSARALVIPSLWYEGQPLVALEAMAAGVPLIVSRIGGLPEVLGERAAGWAAEPGDPDSLRDTLAGLLDDGAVDDRGVQARSRYEEAFTSEAATRRLLSVYAAAQVAVE